MERCARRHDVVRIFNRLRYYRLEYGSGPAAKGVFPDAAYPQYSMTHSLFLAPIAVLVSVSGPIAVHAASTAAEVPAQDFKEFGAYAPLVRSLAGEPDRAKELDFVKACRSRLLRKVDRTEPTEVLLKRFAAEFEADKVHPVTRIVVATLVANMHGALSKEHGDLGSSLLRRFKDKVSEEQFAFLMCARVKIAPYRACGEGAENDAPLKKYLGNILVKHLESEWLTTNPGLQSMLFSLYTADPVNPWLVRDDLAANEAFMHPGNLADQLFVHTLDDDFCLRRRLALDPYRHLVSNRV